MDIRYKHKQKDEEDITNKVRAIVDHMGLDSILVYLEYYITGERIGFFTLEGFHPMNCSKDRFRLVAVHKSYSPNAKTWFKVFKKKEVSNGG